MHRAWPLGLALLILAGCAESPTVPQVNPLPEGRLSSDFGVRSVDPVSGEAKANGHHNGYDLAASMGTPIRASKAGKVAFAGRKGGYGKSVILEHPGGWSTLYGHASRLAVEEGQEVNAGEVVAYVGSTGHSTGPHLHYELRYRGKPVDPGLFTASVPSTPKPRKAKAFKEPPNPVEEAVAAPPPEDVAAFKELPQDAPPLRYPDDPGMRSAMQALDGSAMTPEMLASAEPPTRWQRLTAWLWGALQKFAALLTSRRLG
ncbi:Murein DD-endopeptidase MepM [compost metagenome]